MFPSANNMYVHRKPSDRFVTLATQDTFVWTPPRRPTSCCKEVKGKKKEDRGKGKRERRNGKGERGKGKGEKGKGKGIRGKGNM